MSTKKLTNDSSVASWRQNNIGLCTYWMYLQDLSWKQVLQSFMVSNYCFFFNKQDDEELKGRTDKERKKNKERLREKQQKKKGNVIWKWSILQMYTMYQSYAFLRESVIHTDSYTEYFKLLSNCKARKSSSHTLWKWTGDVVKTLEDATISDQIYPRYG